MLLYENLIFRLQSGHFLDGEIPMTSLVLISFCMCALTETKKKHVKSGLLFFF